MYKNPAYVHPKPELKNKSPSEQPSYNVFPHAGDDVEVAGADRVAEAKKRMKSIGWPEIDADALASSYVLKVLTTLGRWSAKISGLKHELDDFEKSEQITKLLSCSTVVRSWA